MIQIRCFNAQQAHQDILNVLWVWVKAQTTAGQQVDIEARLAEDKKSDQQRRYLHGVVLTQIAKQALVNGQQFDLKVWKEHFRAEYLGFKTVTSINPMTGKRHRRRARISTEDLSVKKYAEYIERITAFACTELSVVFDAGQQNCDPDTGEIYD